MIVDAKLLEARASDQGGTAEVVPRDPWKKVMLDLPLEASMEPVQVRSAVPVESPGSLTLNPIRLDTRRDLTGKMSDHRLEVEYKV